MARIALLSGSVSEGMNNIAVAINAVDGDHRALRLARQNSRFLGNVDDLVINWGRGSGDGYLMARVRHGKVLNKTNAVNKATNKLKSFQAMGNMAGGISTVEWTADRAVAQQWFDTGFPVYARTKLQGHSGEGIVVCSQGELGDLGGVESSRELVQAPLYTKGFNNQRREFRIHVMQGVPTYIQQKKRRENWREIAEYSNIVRNFHTGWIYATANIHPNQKALNEAVKSVAALGLDFGAVDVITRGDDAWVLEINTAPGNEGTNTTTYADNFVRILNGDAPLHYTQRPRVVGEEVEAGNDENMALPGVAAEAMEILQQAIAAEMAPNPLRDAARGRDIAPAPRRAARPVAEVAADVPVAERGQVNNIAPVDKKFYFLEINGEETVGQWTRQLNGFSIIGFAMSIPLADVVIKRVIEA